MLYVDPIRQHGIGLENGARERKALEEFERLFLYQMLREMRKTITQSNLLGGESHRAMFQDMMDDVWAGEMAKSGQLGVADLVEIQLRVQDAQPALAPARRKTNVDDFQGLPLHPPPSLGLPLHPATSLGLPLKRIGTELLELPGRGKGIPLRPSDLSSPTASLPINGTTVSDSPLPRPTGITV
jgi:hypothetical protein